MDGRRAGEYSGTTCPDPAATTSFTSDVAMAILRAVQPVMSRPKIWRAMDHFWISLVPS